MGHHMRLKVDGMGCQGCVDAVRRALAGVPGVDSARVDLAAGQAEVDAAQRVPTALLVEAVESVGYEARPA